MYSRAKGKKNCVNKNHINSYQCPLFLFLNIIKYINILIAATTPDVANKFIITDAFSERPEKDDERVREEDRDFVFWTV